MSATRLNFCRMIVAGRGAAREKWLRMLPGLVFAAAFALPGASASAQDNPIAPKFSIGGQEKRKLTPEEEERQKRLDADYKAAASKIPAQNAPDPWGDLRAPAGSGQKTSASTKSASAPKKKQSAQQPQ